MSELRDYSELSADEQAQISESDYNKLKDTFRINDNNEVEFKIDAFKKKCLLEGLDDIALSLKKSNKIENFENNLKDTKPWILND